MEAFIQGIFTFPTVFFSGLLVLVVLYWLSSLLGMADLDILDGDADLDADGEASGFSSWLIKFKLDGIPLSITISFIILVSWVLSFLAVYFIYPLVPEGWVQISLGIWLLVIIPVIAALLISPFLQPLKPLFRKTHDISAHDYVGRYAVLRTGKVTDNFGEAELQDGGAGLIIKVRAQQHNTFQRGDKIKLLRYDTENNYYFIN